jgi:hypothetical protein
MQKFFQMAIAGAAIVFVSTSAGFAQNAPASGGTAPAATTATSSDTTTTDKAAPNKKKKTAKMTRQQEIDKSVDSGTVPARYRSRVPKEYQQYIPFEKQ